MANSEQKPASAASQQRAIQQAQDRLPVTGNLGGA